MNIVESATISSGTFNNSGVLTADLGPLANYGGPTTSMLPGAGGEALLSLG